MLRLAESSSWRQVASTACPSPAPPRLGRAGRRAYVALAGTRTQSVQLGGRDRRGLGEQVDVHLDRQGVQHPAVRQHARLRQVSPNSRTRPSQFT